MNSRSSGAGEPDRRNTLLRAFFRFLDTRKIPYCLLAGHEAYPTAIDSDIDFMIPPADLPGLRQILPAFAAAYGVHLVQALEHEVGACYYVLAWWDEGGKPDYLELDVTGDYRRRGRLWLYAEELLARRRPNPHGFCVPAPADALLYYLIKRTDKNAVGPEHFARLCRLWQQAPEACRRRLKGYWPDASVGLLHECFESADSKRFYPALPDLRRALLKTHPPGVSRYRQARARGGEWIRRWRRWRRPSGWVIVVLGPDGSGKSSVIEAAQALLAPAFRRTRVVHLRPRLLGGARGAGAAVTDPHALPSRGAQASLFKLLYLVLDYNLGWLVHIRPWKVRSTLVVFDRYLDDLAIDPRRFRYGGPTWAIRLALVLIPRPDMAFVLDAPAAVLQARKREVEAAESNRQREAYRRWATQREMKVLDASRALPDIANDLADRVLRRLEVRLERRRHTDRKHA